MSPVWGLLFLCLKKLVALINIKIIIVSAYVFKPFSQTIYRILILEVAVTCAACIQT